MQHNSVLTKGGEEMERVMIQLPTPLKRKLDALRSQGYTASGYIRALLERELKQNQVAGKQETPWKAK